MGSGHEGPCTGLAPCRSQRSQAAQRVSRHVMPRGDHYCNWECAWVVGWGSTVALALTHDDATIPHQKHEEGSAHHSVGPA